jgi:MFS family permease
MDNGLEATAITEFSEQFWSGRALGIQNTTQRVMALAGPPVFGALIVVGGYPLAFALCGLFPLAAAPVVPVGLVPAGLEDRAAQHGAGHSRWWQTARSHE